MIQRARMWGLLTHIHSESRQHSFVVDFAARERDNSIDLWSYEENYPIESSLALKIPLKPLESLFWVRLFPFSVPSFPSSLFFHSSLTVSSESSPLPTFSSIFSCPKHDGPPCRILLLLSLFSTLRHAITLVFCIHSFRETRVRSLLPSHLHPIHPPQLRLLQ